MPETLSHLEHHLGDRYVYANWKPDIDAVLTAENNTLDQHWRHPNPRHKVYKAQVYHYAICRTIEMNNRHNTEGEGKEALNLHRLWQSPNNTSINKKSIGCVYFTGSPS